MKKETFHWIIFSLAVFVFIFLFLSLISWSFGKSILLTPLLFFFYILLSMPMLIDARAYELNKSDTMVFYSWDFIVAIFKNPYPKDKEMREKLALYRVFLVLFIIYLLFFLLFLF